MEFGQPSILLLLILVPFLLFWYYKIGNKQEASIRFSNLDLIPNEVVQQSSRLHLIFIIVKIVVMLLIIIALARPRLIDSKQKTKTEIIDILLVIDRSSSMLAQDFKPNRLEAAKEVAKTFIKDRIGDRLGTIIFAGDSYINCPLTRDTNVLLDFINEITIVDGEIEQDGTAIGMAIANSINRLRDSSAKSKIIILLSDGSNNKGELDPITAAELASKFGIKIYTIAAGTHGYAPYPVTDVWGRKTLRQMQVDVDEETLMAIAEITNGKFFRATDNESLENIYKKINQLERTEIEVTEYFNYIDLYSWFTIPASLLSILLLIISRAFFGKLF